MFWLLEMDLRLVAVRQMGLSRLQSHGGPLQFWRVFFSHPVTKFGESVLSCSPRKKKQQHIIDWGNRSYSQVLWCYIYSVAILSLAYWFFFSSLGIHPPAAANNQDMYSQMGTRFLLQTTQKRDEVQADENMFINRHAFWVVVLRQCFYMYVVVPRSTYRRQHHATVSPYRWKIPKNKNE